MVEVVAPMVGTVLLLRVAAGADVAEGEALLILESMKMEIPLPAPIAGVLAEWRVDVRDTVEEGDVLAVLRPHDR